MITSYVLLKNQQKKIRKEVKRTLMNSVHKDELVLLKFSKAGQKKSLRWKHSKEFEYNGEMYDIVDTQVSEDSIYYWVWWDHKETKLNKKLDDWVAFVLGNNPKNQENQKQLQHILKSLYFTEDTEKLALAFIEVKKNFYFKQKYYDSIFHTPLIPPPEKC